MMLDKVIGYILLIAGLGLVMFTLFYSYNIFLGKTSAPLVFKTSEAALEGAGASSEILQQVNKAIQEQVARAMPASSVTKTLNLIAWTLLAIILIFGGGVLADIGVKMVRI